MTVADNNNKTAPATHGALLSSAETPEVTDTQIPGSIPARVAPHKVVPISVFVSRKLSKLLSTSGLHAFSWCFGKTPINSDANPIARPGTSCQFEFQLIQFKQIAF